MSSRGEQLCAVQSHGDCDTSEVRTYMSRFQRGLAPTSHRCRFPIAAPRLAPLSVHCGNTLESAARVVFPRASLPLGTNTNLAPPCPRRALSGFGFATIAAGANCRTRVGAHHSRYFIFAQSCTGLLLLPPSLSLFCLADSPLEGNRFYDDFRLSQLFTNWFPHELIDFSQQCTQESPFEQQQRENASPQHQDSQQQRADAGRAVHADGQRHGCKPPGCRRAKVNAAPRPPVCIPVCNPGVSAKAIRCAPGR
jgi:hypothetical protein